LSNLLANRAIGTILALEVNPIADESPGAWVVNVDGLGEDGRIDLIDVQNNIGNIDGGGPALATGPGGNVRYMRAGGEIVRDRFFGLGQGSTTTYAPGERVSLTDDNGTSFTMNPIPLVRAIDPVTGFPVPGFDQPGFLTVTAYPVRDGAGSVIARVTANTNTGGGGPPGRGVEIVTGTRGRGGSVEFGEIIVRSVGTDLVFNPFTRAFTPEVTTNPPNNAEGQNSDVLLRGPSLIDVWSVEVRDPASNAFTGLTRIVNDTAGEIVNVQAAHIGGISADTVGLAKSSTGAAVVGVNVQSNAYPFRQQRNLVIADSPTGPGHIASIRARRGLGNILAIGSIGEITANADGRNIGGVFEGVNAPVVALAEGTTASELHGNITNVAVGEGLAASGSGDVGFSGLYADGLIDRVRASGAGRDIRGDIVARGFTVRVTQTVGGVTSTTPTFIIGDIILNNAAIIDADILNVTDFEDAREFVDTIFISGNIGDTLTNPVNDIRSITINGIGGILGSYIAVDDMGLVSINGGFGMIASVINSLGDSTLEGVVTDGYGIRSSVIEGGANINFVHARGNGKRLDTRSYTGSVRNSERMSFDPHTGHLLDGSNDLHKYLGTTRAQPKRKGLSDSGSIEDSHIIAQRTLGDVQANRIIGRNVFFTDASGRRRRIPFGAVAYPMRISFGESVQSIRVRDFTDGPAITGGNLGRFDTAGDVIYTAVNVNGRIGTISAGALRGTSSIKSRGPQGAIDNITTRRSLFATIESTQTIGTIKVGTDLGSPSVSTSRNLGLLSIDGSVLTGANVRVARILGTLDVGRDVQSGATIRADEISNQEIGGQVQGDIIIT
jgi:hypothetical protein